MRGKKSPRRPAPLDDKYQNPVVGKFINNVMERGKKSVAQKIVYGSIDKIAGVIKDSDPVEVFLTAVKNVMPLVEVRSRRVGGANYQIPVEVRPERKQMLAFRWLIGAAKKKKGRPMAIKLADEIMAAYKGEGEAIKKRDEVHRMAESNRAFAHFGRSRN